MTATKIRGRADVQITGGEIDACPVGGHGMMTRFDGKLIDWWNPAQRKLLASKEYHQICQDVKVNHGKIIIQSEFVIYIQYCL